MELYHARCQDLQRLDQHPQSDTGSSEFLWANRGVFQASSGLNSDSAKVRAWQSLKQHRYVKQSVLIEINIVNLDLPDSIYMKI